MCCEEVTPKIRGVVHQVHTFSIDKYFAKESTPDYNCLDFTRDVWLELTGIDITAHLLKLTGAFVDRKATLSGLRAFKRLTVPVSPCLAVLQRKGMTPHIGVYIDRRVLHLHPRGVEYQPLAVVREYFTSVAYYK